MSTIKKILIAAISVIAISFIVIKFLPNEKPPVEKIKITIGTFSKSMGNVPYYIAKDKGWFEKAIGDKFIIEYNEFNDRPSIASALSSGNLKFIFSAEIPAMLIKAQGENILFESLSATLTQEIIVHSDSKLKKIGDLKGKKVAVLAGTSSHYALLKILDANGLKPDDVKIVLMPPAEAKVAFETKQIDAWAVWPPWVEQQQVTKFARSLEGSNAIITSVGSMPVEFVKNNPAIADSLSNIIYRAKDWILNNTEEAQMITAKQLDLDTSIVKLAWTKFHWSAKYNSEILNDMQNKAAFLSNEKLTRNNLLLDVNKELIGTNLK